MGAGSVGRLRLTLLTALSFAGGPEAGVWDGQRCGYRGRSFLSSERPAAEPQAEREGVEGEERRVADTAVIYLTRRRHVYFNKSLYL